MLRAVLALLLATATAHAGQYWEVEETTLVEVRPTQYQEDVYYGNIQPAAGPRVRWGNGQWQGLHVGITVQRDNGKTSYKSPYGTSDTFKDSGTNVGGQVGYTWQSGPLTYGVEGDYATSNNKGDDNFAFGQQDKIKGKWQASARGRVGVAVGRVMPYATAGWGWQNTTYTIYDDILGTSANHQEILNGPTYGAGVEVALTDRITTRGEFRRTDYGSDQFDAYTSVASAREYEHNQDSFIWSLNYRFPEPPAR
ncbi:MAG: porin family protein [Pseudomonadaceae bacterium]|nr:porin family protein [Pseudomonadaceae bacterium]